jgi:hypothetical protein
MSFQNGDIVRVTTSYSAFYEYIGIIVLAPPPTPKAMFHVKFLPSMYNEPATVPFGCLELEFAHPDEVILNFISGELGRIFKQLELKPSERCLCILKTIDCENQNLESLVDLHTTISPTLSG